MEGFKMEMRELEGDDLMVRAKKINAEHNKGYKIDHPNITKLTPLLKD
jgi:hypothetical protein